MTSKSLQKCSFVVGYWTVDRENLGRGGVVLLVIDQNDGTVGRTFYSFHGKILFKNMARTAWGRTASVIWSILFADLNRPLSPKLAKEDICIIDMNLHGPRLACFRLFLNLELFWMNIIKQLLNSAFVGYEEFCRSWRVLSTKADNSDPPWSAEFFISYSSGLFNNC